MNSSAPQAAATDKAYATTVAEEQAGIDVSFDAPPADPRPLDELPTIGHVGRYALKYPLGEGGLGAVYAAYDPLLSRSVAVKTLHIDLSASAGYEALLLHEARAAAALSHQYIVTVFDAGISDDSVYVAMEKLEGRDLRQLLAAGWRPNVRQAAVIVRRIAEALAYAHGKGVIHCDIKPANIFMVGRTTPKVLDFGIARVAHRPDPDTRTLLGGSPHYMAPEQVRGDAVDRRCDVYSLGVVLYELLTGRRAHAGITLDEISDSVLNRMPPPAHHVDPRVPPALSAIAERAMAKRVDDRHRSAHELARELRGWLDEQAPQQPRAERRTKLAWGMGATILASVAAGVAFSVWNGGSGVAPAATASRGAAAVRAPAAVAATLPAEAVSPATTPTPVSAGQAVPVARQDAQRVTSTQEALPMQPAAPPQQLAAGPRTKPRPARRPVPREASPVRASPPAAVAPAPAPQGVVQIAVSPWGAVEVDGKDAGTAPPLNRLSLDAGSHTIVIRNADFVPYTTIVNVTAGQPVTLKYRFGS